MKHGDQPGDLRNCRVSEFGEFASIDGQTYYYLLYFLIPNYAPGKGTCDDGSFDARYHRERGLAIFAGDAPSASASLLFERVDGELRSLRYSRPQIVMQPREYCFTFPSRSKGTQTKTRVSTSCRMGTLGCPSTLLSGFRICCGESPPGLRFGREYGRACKR